MGKNLDVLLALRRARAAYKAAESSGDVSVNRLYREYTDAYMAALDAGQLGPTNFCIPSN